MHDLEVVLKAAADPTRARILKLLERGGLCVCQVRAVLDLAPSTVSKHLTILKHAGLVQDQRDGKWIEYSLADASHNPHARPVLDLVRTALARDRAALADRTQLREVKRVPKSELQVQPGMPGRAARRGAQ